MIRKTLTILSLIGLLFSVALWGVSYFEVWFGLQGSHWTDGNAVVLGGNAIVLGEGAIIYAYLPGGADSGWSIQEFRGFDTRWLPDYEYDTTFSVLIACHFPLWIPTIVFAALSLWSGYVPIRRRRKRKKLGLCLKCGYDLRASKDRCPECGETK